MAIKCDIRGSSENVLVNHFEDHLKRRLNICLECHGHLYVTVKVHGYDVLWKEGFGDPLERKFYESLHRKLVEKGLIKCKYCGA